MDSITFIGACFPDSILNKLIEQDMIDDLPANVFGWKIVHSLSLNNVMVTVLNEHKIPRNKWSQYSFMKGKQFTVDNVDFINYKFSNRYMRKVSKALSIFKQLINVKPEVIVVYCIHTPFLLPAVLYSLIRPKTKIIQIVPDLPAFMSFNNNFFVRFLKKIDVFIQRILLMKVNGWILLSRHMKEPLKIVGDNYIVIEGICDDEPEEIDLVNKKNFILYSGGLVEQYGLPEFINAFIESELPCDFFLCGKGGYTEKIKEISKKHAKIKYIGVLRRSDLKKMQKEALLLVNPRSSTDEYTKFSFPSKTMEYLLSGTPVMMERLLGIPDEYYDYIIEVKNGNWVDSLKEFYYGNNSDMNLLGNHGSEFVKKKKNAFYQGSLIKEYIEKVVSTQSC